jgi:hypothetical protein
VVKLQCAQVLVQTVAHQHRAVAADLQQRGLRVAQRPGGGRQLLLSDAVDVCAGVRNWQAGSDQGVDEHLHSGNN